MNRPEFFIFARICAWSGEEPKAGRDKVDSILDSHIWSDPAVKGSLQSDPIQELASLVNYCCFIDEPSSSHNEPAGTGTNPSATSSLRIGDSAAMAGKKKKAARRKAPVDDIRASFQEALALAASQRAGTKVRRVTPRETAARRRFPS